MEIRVQSDRFAPGVELDRFTAKQSGAGAVVTFSGLVRNGPSGDLLRLEIEHYAGMTERALHQICTEATTRWSLLDALVIHRYGSLDLGDPIMMVATAAKHRAEAFEAAEYLMDYLKSRAPFWKSEVMVYGRAWVDARDADEQALSRWQSDPKGDARVR